MNKRALIFIPAIILLATIVLISKPEYRWLIFNVNSAETYAIELLAGKSPKTPDWAIDLVVTKENGLVVFREHGANMIYAFSQDKMPSKEGIAWSY